MKVQPIYNNKLFKKGLEFAADNGALFVATTSLVLSTVARPLVILSTPKTDSENKKYAASKSLASSAAGYILMLCASLPLSKAIKKIDNNPSKYLTDKTINTLRKNEKILTKSSRYKFATQLFKLGLGFFIAVPKSIMTCAMIPSFMEKIFKSKKNSTKNESAKQPNFTGLEKPISKVINNNKIQKFAEKYHDTNFPLHIMSLTDSLATGAFIAQTAKSKKIDDNRKTALMYNAGISTLLSILGGYVINSLTKKSTDKFIKRFKQENINSKNLDKYVEGIKIAKPALILGGIYYIIIPLISTFLADRFDKKGEKIKLSGSL